MNDALISVKTGCMIYLLLANLCNNFTARLEKIAKCISCVHSAEAFMISGTSFQGLFSSIMSLNTFKVHYKIKNMVIRFSFIFVSKCKLFAGKNLKLWTEETLDPRHHRIGWGIDPIRYLHLSLYCVRLNLQTVEEIWIQMYVALLLCHFPLSIKSQLHVMLLLRIVNKWLSGDLLLARVNGRVSAMESY